MNAADLGRGIEAGRIDPVDLTEMFLSASAGHGHAARIYARLTPERAFAEAKAARGRAKAGHRLGLLDGVPISWKDNFDTAGIVTEAGSALLAGRVPARDAEVLANATAAGLVCLGKTHMSELAFSGLGLNPITATAPNVNDPGAVPGGSSSGAAASVAFGLAPAAVGSDTGGSVRIPAAWQDLVGLKTTLGQLSCRGVVPLIERFDTVGPLAKTVEDAALLLAALGGSKPVDLAGVSLADSRFLVLEDPVLADTEKQPAEAFDRAVEGLSAKGAQVERGSFAGVAEALGLSGTLYSAEAYAIWRGVIEAAPDKMYPPILERFRSGARASAVDFVAGWRRIETLRQGWAAHMAGYDAVVLPASPILPPNADRLDRDRDYYARSNLLALRNARIGNLFGLSALTLPTGTPSTGIMLMGAAMGEAALLRLGAAVEAALR